VIESESASTIAIAKETITRLANYRRVTLEETVSANESAIHSFLQLIRGKLDYQLDLSRKVLLVDAVQELAQIMPEGSQEVEAGQAVAGSWLSEEYQFILQNQETIRKEFKTRARSVEYLAGIVTDLFVDYHRIQGQDAKHRIAALQQHVLNMNMTSITSEEYFAGILKFFTTK
jgi:Bardet-Biedl syndrome 7 protein